MRRFGEFEFDGTTRRLRRGAADIHLPPKAFDLLAVLLDCSPRVVTKRELHARLWPGGLVSDATLAALVKQLRRALKDAGGRASMLRTVHRVGYALDADAAPAPSPASTRTCWLQLGERRLALGAGENLVGRDDAAQLVLEDASVSRRHARILVADDGARIEDLGSKNGTFVDGARLSGGPVPLTDGCRIRFGSLAASFRCAAGTLPTLTHFAPAD